METILQACKKERVAIELNDRPENDFTTLSLTVTKWEDGIDKAKYPQELFIALRPRSFYKPLSALEPADVGYCFTCLHFLENMPHFPHGYFTANKPPETVEMLRAQAQTDLQKFLHLRASEFAPGGHLVISLIGSGFGPDFMNSGLGDAVRRAVRELHTEGKLNQETLETCVLPIYFRSRQDIQQTVDSDEVREKWSIVKIDQSYVEHPFRKDLFLSKEQGSYTEEKSFEYADAMVNMFMVVFGGFFIRALTLHSKTLYSEERAQQLLEETHKKAVRNFIEDNKDGAVQIGTIYVHLQRRTQ